MQIDASFHALRPYTYCVPLLIIHNASIPIGLSLGPSESSNLFDVFFQNLSNIDKNFKLTYFPILSDEGKAIKKFTNNEENVKHFFCYRHIIEKMGSNSLIGGITRNLLFQTKYEYYKKVLPQAISDINLYFENQLISEKSIKKFVKVFQLSISEKNEIINTEYDHEHGLWNRQQYGVSTCSNHIERLHRTMNTAVKGISCVHLRLSIVISSLEKYCENFEKNSRKQAKKLFMKLQNKGKENNLKDCCGKCGWSAIYSNRFGIEGFPCVHNACNVMIDLDDIKAPFFDSNQRSITEKDQLENWNFPTVITKTRKEKEINDYEVIETCFENDELSFIQQTAQELSCYVTQEYLKKIDLQFEITKMWGYETHELSDEQRLDVAFRSYFKLKVITKMKSMGIIKFCLN